MAITDLRFAHSLLKQGFSTAEIKKIIGLKPEDKTEDDPEDKTEDDPEDKTEGDPEDKTEGDPEDDPEDKTEDDPEDNPEVDQKKKKENPLQRTEKHNDYTKDNLIADLNKLF